MELMEPKNDSAFGIYASLRASSELAEQALRIMNDATAKGNTQVPISVAVEILQTIASGVYFDQEVLLAQVYDGENKTVLLKSAVEQREQFLDFSSQLILGCMPPETKIRKIGI